MNDLFATVDRPVVLIVGVTDTSVNTFALSPESNAAIADALYDTVLSFTPALSIFTAADITHHQTYSRR